MPKIQIFGLSLDKDIYNTEYLSELGLNNRQVKAVLYVKEKGKITNKEYQVLNDISNRTATNELTELVTNFAVLKVSGAGAGTFYHL
ncbi:MAG: hypothetical protein KF900_00810 [Bacteroidetes bacterium]|nr:hypothetical protein [Bacteroidota bacterium]